MKGNIKPSDLIIQNIGAVKASKSNCKMETSKDVLTEKNNEGKLRGIVENLYEKFKKKELELKNFEDILEGLGCDENGNLPKRKTSEDSETDLDRVLPVDFELDFENGEITVTETCGKEEKVCKVEEKDPRRESKGKTPKFSEEKQINKQMKLLMGTFEQEKKNLLRKVELEKELIAKKVADDYERKLKVEKDFLGAIIADLVKSVEDARSQVEELKMIREHDRMTLQKFFKRKLADERKKLMLEVVAKQGRA